MKFASLSGWRSGATQALIRFPLNFLSAVVGATAAIVAIHWEKNEWLVGQCTRLLMGAAVGMPLFFSLRMLRERTVALRRWPFELAGLPLIAAWIWAQPARPFDS